MNALIFFLPLLTVSLEVPNFRQRERQTGQLNDFDGSFDLRTSNNEVITGLWSEHNNDREDRIWKAYFSSAPGIVCNPGSLSRVTELDQPFDFTCPEGQAMAGFQSRHNNEYEDRDWRFSCCDINEAGNKRYRMYRYERVQNHNAIDNILDQRCNENQVMVGLTSVHSNNREDRWYNVKCALVVPVEHRDDVEHPLYLPQEQSGRCFLTSNYGYPGTIDSDRGARSSEECQQICAEVSECQFWTWNPTNHFCYLNAGANGGNDFINRNTAGLVSGPKVGCHAALCVRLTTGSQDHDEGNLDVFANGDFVASGYHNQGTRVWQDCYDTEPTVEVGNTSLDAWVGIVEVSMDGGNTWYRGGCSGCIVNYFGSVAVLVVDGNYDASHRGQLACLGLRCEDEENCIGANRCELSLDAYQTEYDATWTYENQGDLGVIVDIGQHLSTENVKVVENVGSGNLRCPEIVNRDNWRNPADEFVGAPDQFRVEVINGRDVRVTRTDEVNGWDFHLRLPCHENNFGIMSAIGSWHDNGREDRRFQFTTRTFEGLSCDPTDWTAYQNQFDQELNFVCPRGQAIAGIGSQHDNGREDRQFRFRCCEVAKNGYELGESRRIGVNRAPNSEFIYDTIQFSSCEANEVMIGMRSWHDNGKEDRQFSVECAILKRPPPPAPVFDNCVQINVLEAIFDEHEHPVFGPEEEQLAELQTLATDLNFCGNPRVPTEVTIAQSGEESVSKSETLEIERSLDTVFSFAAGINTALDLGVEVTRAIERWIRSRSTSLGFDFNVGASADAGIQFGLGTARTSATTVSTTSVSANSITTNIEPKPFQRFVSVGSRRTQDVVVPMRMRLECVREDGSRREETIGSRLITQGTTNIEVSFEDRTSMCPQSYYRNCECVPDLKSNFVGTGCVSHPDFTGHPGCYVYRGNGQDQSCTNGEALQTTSGASDEGVDGIAFGFSYIPCGGDQYYPGDARFTGLSFDDLVLLVPRTQCLSGTGGTLSNEPFETRNAAIEACYLRNLETPDTCAGVYDPQCDNAGQFFLCSVNGGLNFSNGQNPSCTYRLQDTMPDPANSPFPTEENGFTRSVPSLQTALPPFAGRRLEIDDELVAPAAFEELADDDREIQLRRF